MYHRSEYTGGGKRPRYSRPSKDISTVMATGTTRKTAPAASTTTKSSRKRSSPSRAIGTLHRLEPAADYPDEAIDDSERKEEHDHRDARSARVVGQLREPVEDQVGGEE